MSIDTDHPDGAAGSPADHSTHSSGHDAHDGNDSHGLSDKGYVAVALILGLMTAAEVALSYIDLPGWFFMSALLTLMVVKFVTVVSFFMHLKFDSKVFTWLFYSGLLLAVFVYIAALATFQFFAPG